MSEGYLISEKTGEIKSVQEWIEDAKIWGWDFSKADMTPVIWDEAKGWIDPNTGEQV